MLRPSRDEFRALAREHTVVPVWRELAADLETPVSAFLKLAPDDTPGCVPERSCSFLLESVEHGERWGRFSFVGRDPALVLVARDGHITLQGDAPAVPIPTDEGVLAAVEALLAGYRAPTGHGGG